MVIAERYFTLLRPFDTDTAQKSSNVRVAVAG